MTEKQQLIAYKILFRDPINVLKFHAKISGWNLGIEKKSGQIFLRWKSRLLM